MTIKTRLFGAALIAVSVSAVASAGWSGDLTAAEIACLPQDEVETAKRECVREWPNDFHMRLHCEDKQFKALRALVERGSIKPQGDKL